MKLSELIIGLRRAAASGAEKALSQCAAPSATISKAEAYRTYGRTNIDRWCTEGLIKISRKTFNREQLAAIASSSNRLTYLPVAER
jgi:peptidyl-tRNA hydrolase